MNKKTVIVFVVVLLLVIGGAYIIAGGQNSTPDSSLSKVESEEIQISPESYDIGKVIMKEGIVTREYEIKNNSENVLRVKNVVTSCMCTRAQIIFGDKRTRLYSMEMAGAKNPNVDFDIPGGETAKLIVKFDPAAHGIQGVGLVQRSVFLTFLDPVGTREVGFSGEVALK